VTGSALVPYRENTANAVAVANATKLFRSFFGRNPSPEEIVDLCFPNKPEPGLVVGKIVGIMYRTKYDSKPFWHEFGEESGNRPLLVVTSDGSQFYPLRGAYRFTARGFID
jgi:hypothetical protein